MYTIVGLGNPGAEYAKTRHNTGRIIAERLGFRVLDDFMNKSGSALLKISQPKVQSAKLIIIHDDLDLPLGKFKISFGKSAGGHRGVASIIKALKTQEFVRIRVGISPSTPSGKLKKPMGEKKVLDFILSSFKRKELEIIKKQTKKIAKAISITESEGVEAAMNMFN